MKCRSAQTRCIPTYVNMGYETAECVKRRIPTKRVKEMSEWAKEAYSDLRGHTSSDLRKYEKSKSAKEASFGKKSIGNVGVRKRGGFRPTNFGK